MSIFGAFHQTFLRETFPSCISFRIDYFHAKYCLLCSSVTIGVGGFCSLWGINDSLRRSCFEFCGIPHILFGVDAISSREPVLSTSTPVGDGAVQERLITLRANVTSFGCHPVLFQMLLLAVFESELERRQLWLPLYIFPRIRFWCLVQL